MVLMACNGAGYSLKSDGSPGPTLFLMKDPPNVKRRSSFSTLMWARSLAKSEGTTGSFLWSLTCRLDEAH